MVQGSQKKNHKTPPPDFAGVIELRIWDGEAHRLRERTFFLAVPHSMWDLSSPTRDRTHAQLEARSLVKAFIKWIAREVPRE